MTATILGPSNGVPVSVMSSIPTNLHDGIRNNTNTTDLAPYFQEALDRYNKVVMPYGYFKLSSIKLAFHQALYGSGMDASVVIPMDGYDTMILTSDFITLSEFSFRDTALGYTEATPTISANCIVTDAVSSNAAFTRALQGIDINKILFMNIDGAAIDIRQALRESWIQKNRLFGMGSVANSKGVIHALESIGSGTNINNLWIDDNEFYRFAMPCLNFKASTILANTVPSYADIRLRDNLFHNQKLNTSSNVQPVEAEETDTVLLERIINLRSSGNSYTSVHVNYSGLKIVNHANYEGRRIKIIGDDFAGDTGRGDVTYPGTGNMIDIAEVRTLQVMGNDFRVNSADRHANDLVVTRTNANPIDVNIQGNTIVNGSLLFNIDTWKGTYEKEGIPQGDFTGAAKLIATTGVDYGSFTDAQLNDISHSINTTGKTLGKHVFNSTQNIPVYAAGTGAGGLWLKVSDNTTANTPV